METQQIVDLVMREIAVRHGSTRRRDFEVALITIEAIESARALPAICGASEDAKRSGSATERRDILTTECCGVVLEVESRFCPKCGWECRIRRTSSGEARTAPEPAKEPRG